MNSAYGFFGASKGFLPCLPLAASTTTIGRQMIAQTKAMAESLVPGSKVIYGDSVAGYTPLLLRCDGHIGFLPIERLADGHKWTVMSDGKEACELDGVETYTEQGWTRVERVIRHRLAPGKRIARVLTHAGMVDVTSDHSLLLSDGTPIRPSQLFLGAQLLHFPRTPLGDDQQPFNEKEAYIIGSLVTQGWTEKLPRILNATRPLKEAFWNGLKESAAPKKYVFVRSQLAAAHIYAIGDALGHRVGIDSSLELYVIFFPQDDAELVRGVCKLERLPPRTGEYVYDLTTTNHHFSAGVGNLVVHNTDSVLVIFNCGPENRTDVHAHFKVAQEVADTITKEFKKPNELEFEKVRVFEELSNPWKYAHSNHWLPLDVLSVHSLHEETVRRYAVLEA